MSFCTKCGNQVSDGSLFCEKCGTSVVVAETVLEPVVEPAKRQSGIVTAIKVFLIIGTIFVAISTYGIGLAWSLPMTISYFKRVESGARIGVGFKICTALFINTVAGLLMLGSNEN